MKNEKRYLEFDPEIKCPICKHVGVDVYFDDDGESYNCKCGHEWLNESKSKQNLTITNKEDLRHVMYHAKDIDKENFYICPDCFHKDLKTNRSFYEDTTVFTQEGHPVTTPYICSMCEKEKRCLSFRKISNDTKNNTGK